MPARSSSMCRRGPEDHHQQRSPAGARPAIVPFIEGDGTGPDIWRASVRVLDAAVAKAYGGKRRIHWMEVYAGQKSNDLYNTWLPDETVEACREYSSRSRVRSPRRSAAASAR